VIAGLTSFSEIAESGIFTFCTLIRFDARRR